jgi:exonuclease SbcC
VKLTALRLRDVPGLPDGLELEDLGAPVLLLLGPNGSGKSTARRCLEQLLFERHPRLRHAHLWARFAGDAGQLEAEQQGGQVLWSEQGRAAPRPELPPAERADCYAIGARELLVAGDTERNFAAEVRRAMSGGFDLGRARAALAGDALGPRFGANLATALREQATALLALERELDELADREDQLAESTAQVARAEADAARLAQLEAALAQWSEAEGELRPLEQELEQRRAELADLRAQEAALAAGGPLLAVPELEALAAELSELRQGEDRLRRAEEAEARGAERLAVARAALHGAAVAERTPPAAAALAELDRCFSEREDLRQRQREVAARLVVLGPPAAEVEGSLEALQAALGDLQQWSVAAPGLERQVPRWAGIAAALLLVAATAGAVLWSPWLALAAGAALGLLLAKALSDAAFTPVRQQRQSAQERFLGRGLPEPEAWERAAVLRRIEALHRDRDQLRRREAELGERLRLEQQGAELRARLAALDGELEQWRAAQDLPEEVDGLGLVEWSRRCAAWAAAQLEAAGERGAAEALRRARAAAGAELAARLGFASGGAANGGTPTVAALAARREELLRRAQAHRRLRDRRQDLERELERRERDVERLRARLRAATEPLTELLSGGGASSAAAALAELEPELDRLRRSAAGRDRLRDQIQQVQTELDLARRRGDWEERRAELQRLRLELAAAHGERAAALCGLELLEDVEREYERESRPVVLERARELFARFTHHRYDLTAELRAGGDAHFSARDVAAGAPRELDQLSDGTRMQLLLALRIAFAESGEPGERLPIVLDEVFSMSDPERVRSMVEALGELADDGRQVLYLGADPAIEAAWRAIAEEAQHPAPHVVHLSRVQRALRGVADARQLSIRAARSVPEPGGRSPEEYGRELGVDLPRPFEDPGRLHLFHLLRDDLFALARLIRQSHERLGQWELLSGAGGGAGALGDPRLAAVLDARAAAARAALEAWHLGQSRPIGRAELVASGAVSETFLDAFAEFLRDCQGDPGQLLEGLEREGAERDPRLKRFKRAKTEELAAWLLEQRFLDRRERLTPAEQDQRAREAAPALDPVYVAELAAELRSHLERAERAPVPAATA